MELLDTYDFVYTKEYACREFLYGIHQPKVNMSSGIGPDSEKICHWLNNSNSARANKVSEVNGKD